MDSNNVIDPLLAHHFDRKKQGLQTAEAIAFLAQTIAALPVEGTKVISLIGGAASGKSTLAKAIIEQLAPMALRADTIGTDDFNKGDRAWRWKHFEDKEGANQIDKKDFALLNAKVAAIRRNRGSDTTVAVPTYNQTTGLAIDEGEDNYTHRIGSVDVLIVEGDFHPVTDPDLVVYLHVPDQQRLRIRVARDVKHRGGDLAKTTASFTYRQRVQHVPHTLPTAEQADYVMAIDAANATWIFDVYQAKPATPLG